MKALFTILCSVFILATASATNFDTIILGTKGTSSLQAKFSSSKNTIAVLTITNEQGKVIATKSIVVSKGNNNVDVIDIRNLSEGTFKVSITTDGITESTTFINL